MERQTIKSCGSSTLFTIVAVWLMLFSSCETNCPIIQASDLSSTGSGLIAATFPPIDDNATVEIQDYKVVCLAQGTVRDTYRFVSLVVNYTYNGTERISQFQFECQLESWNTNVSGSVQYSRTDPPSASLETALRTDCAQCIDPRQLSSVNNTQHCSECHESCSEGVMRCTSDDSCCNYFNAADECLSVCPNNSQPTNESQCICIGGYQGVNCDMDINECLNSSIPCMNDGACNNTIGGFMCICPPGYTGDRCQSDINECNSDPCMNEAMCNNTSGNYSCSCQAGYTGSICETEINECDSEPCTNGGTCEDLVNSYNCSCSPGYTGKNCSDNIDECATSLSMCTNGATCIDNIGSYICECAPGYTGQTCELNVNDCAPNPCKNGGYCNDSVNQFSCNCSQGWSGNVCDDCTLQACSNCTPDADQGFRAVCVTCDQGYTLTTADRSCALQSSSLGAGAITGIAVACLIGVVLAILLVVLMVAILRVQRRTRYSSTYRMTQVQADKESSVHVMKNPVYLAPASVEEVDSGITIEADEHLAVNKAALEFEEDDQEDSL